MKRKRGLAIWSLVGIATTFFCISAHAGKYVRINSDVDLYVEEAGSGTPLIFIPGWTFSTDVFKAQLASFSKNYRVITFDPRSHGRSSVTLENNNYTQHGKDLAALIEAMRLKNVIIAGWSFGCLDGLAYVRAEGISNIKAFVCIDNTPKALGSKGEWAIADFAGWKGSVDGVTYNREQFMRGFAPWMIERPLTPTEIDWMVDLSLRTPTYAATLLFTDAIFADYTPEAVQMNGKLPVLHIVRKDWSEAAKAWIQNKTPQAEVVVLGKHMMFWEYPDEFNRVLADFLARTNR